MKRLECLDGLRGLLAVYVMVSHMASFAAMPGWLIRALSHGGAAVDVFFILSGMVIIRSLDSYGHRALPFLIARVFRIYPVFLAVFALAVMTQELSVDFAAMPWIGPDSLGRMIWADHAPQPWALRIGLHLGMVHGLFPDGILPYVWLDYLGAAWSLSTEWQFYIVAVWLARRNGDWRMAMAVLALAAMAGLWHHGAPPEWQFSRAFLPNKAHLFALGIASAAWLRDGDLRRFIVVLVAVLLICIIQDGQIGKIAAPLVWMLCLAAQTRAGAGLRWLAGGLRARPVLWLGSISYCVYLVNEPVQKWLGWALAQVAAGDARLFTLLWLPLAVLLPVGVAWWLHVAIEQPGLQWGKTIVRRLVSRDPALNSPSPRPIFPSI